MVGLMRLRSLRLAALVLGLVAFGSAIAAIGSAAGAPTVFSKPFGESTPSFEPGPCPKTPHPIEALKTARCGYLVVPENRAHPNGRTIRNAVAIVPAQSKTPKPDPVVFMTGGPGAAAILDIPFLVDAGINQNRELIVMAQRGTLYDKPDLYCPELDHFYARQVSMAFDAPSTGAKQAAAARACHDRLVHRGTEPAAYNTTENAADFAELRQALGVKEWNVYGYSYGSDLALSFMRDHPEGIRTVTIDSVVPPNIVSLPWTWSSTREGITTIFKACEAQPSCNRHHPDLLPTFIDEVRRLEAHPLVRRVRPPQGGSPVKVVLDGGTLVNMLVGNVPRWPEVPAAITELAYGDPHRFLEARAAGAVVPENPEQALGMTNSFICQEWEPYGAPRRDPPRRPQGLPDLPRLGPGQRPAAPLPEGVVPRMGGAEGSCLPAGPGPQRHPNAGRVRRRRLQNRCQVGALCGADAQPVDLRADRQRRPLGDRPVALRPADLPLLPLPPDRTADRLCRPHPGLLPDRKVSR